ncbi:hypothetical protein GOP47_0019066 [Adiantum capillus-veneris]|uniref:Uncharacterized protein n=1 Tax=Adiantum capillus-veneris TaxID=13818 RepID=A0A9D4ZA67_ADICA|nr:hypothetical protein GOP47_0019066 [Adiantum capillus-veneris]
MVGAEGPAPDTVVGASLNSEVLVYRLSIDGTVPPPDTSVDASLNSEVPTHRVSVDGSVPSPQQVDQESPLDDHPNTTSRDHGTDLLSPNASL